MKNRIKPNDLKQLKLKQLESQDNMCAVCGFYFTDKEKNNNPKNIHWDHNHETGKMRGVLCRRCNIIEGKAWNSYLRQTKKERRYCYEFIEILQGLVNYYNNYNLDLIHPTFRTKDEKRLLKNKRAKRIRLKRLKKK